MGVAIYVGLSSLRLARESVTLLLGTSASPRRRAQLEAIVSGTPHVLGVAKLMALHHGPSLHVEVDVLVDASLTLGAAHDVAHAIEERLGRESDVAHVIVHVTPASGGASN